MTSGDVLPPAILQRKAVVYVRPEFAVCRKRLGKAM
jgi:hypothetical protein